LLESSLCKKFFKPILNQYLGMVVCTCHPSYSEGWEWEYCGSRPSMAKRFRSSHLNGHGGTYLLFQLLWEVLNRRISFQSSLGKKWDSPISKITGIKRSGDLAQAVNLVPSKSKALSSNPNSTVCMYIKIELTTKYFKMWGILSFWKNVVTNPELLKSSYFLPNYFCSLNIVMCIL
jgi:hypothetical protein